MISSTDSNNLDNMSTALIASFDHDTWQIIDWSHRSYDVWSNPLQLYGTITKNNIITTNEGIAPVTGAGSITLTSNLSLQNCLLLPSLSSNLLFMGQVTEQLNCVVLMFPTFYLLQDIRTQTIIGRGTKRKGLYYVDDVVSGHVHQVRSYNSGKMKTV